MIRPIISTILPVFNGATYIQEALASIIAQDFPEMEIIVVDDGSTDDTSAIVKAFTDASPVPIQFLRQENFGPAAARNRGIALARGSIIAFQDADDIWMKNKLEIQMPLLVGEEAADVILGFMQLFKRVPKSGGDGYIEERSDPHSSLCFQVALFRRSVFDLVGPIDETLRTGEDMDWFLRARQAGVRIKIHTDPVVLYRRHDSNLTKSTLGNPSEMLLLLKKSLARQRQNRSDAND